MGRRREPGVSSALAVSSSTGGDGEEDVEQTLTADRPHDNLDITSRVHDATESPAQRR
jgi:hypothetical protein